MSRTSTLDAGLTAEPVNDASTYDRRFERPWGRYAFAIEAAALARAAWWRLLQAVDAGSMPNCHIHARHSILICSLSSSCSSEVTMPLRGWGSHQ
jgi:hypothetical protein